jgi:hypothetical protein
MLVQKTSVIHTHVGKHTDKTGDATIITLHLLEADFLCVWTEHNQSITITTQGIWHKFV